MFHREEPHYEGDEITAAIGLSGRLGSRHRVVPVYLQGFPEEPPYGLAVKHGFELGPDCTVEDVARRLATIF